MSRIPQESIDLEKTGQTHSPKINVIAGITFREVKMSTKETGTKLGEIL